MYIYKCLHTHIIKRVTYSYLKHLYHNYIRNTVYKYNDMYNVNVLKNEGNLGAIETVQRVGHLLCMWSIWVNTQLSV